jgi:hypothetical protein
MWFIGYGYGGMWARNGEPPPLEEWLWTMLFASFCVPISMFWFGWAGDAHVELKVIQQSSTADSIQALGSAHHWIGPVRVRTVHILRMAPELISRTRQTDVGIAKHRDLPGAGVLDACCLSISCKRSLTLWVWSCVSQLSATWEMLIPSDFRFSPMPCTRT